MNKEIMIEINKNEVISITDYFKSVLKKERVLKSDLIPYMMIDFQSMQVDEHDAFLLDAVPSSDIKILMLNEGKMYLIKNKLIFIFSLSERVYSSELIFQVDNIIDLKNQIEHKFQVWKKALSREVADVDFGFQDFYTFTQIRNGLSKLERLYEIYDFVKSMWE